LPEKERIIAEMNWREKRAEKKRAKVEMSDEKKAALEEVKNQSAHLDPDNDTTDPAPFKDKPSRLAMLVDPKSLADLEKIGGIQGVLEGLGVDPSKGLDAGKGGAGTGTGAQWTADVAKRQEVYGKNELPTRKSKSLFYLMWMALKDKVLVSILSLPEDFD
jgi:Ca2+-transporting ATPase